MKKGKKDDKAMRPMFPRLHVNDADKGGPRAPPRNKMALYEQLSIPSQRFNPTALPPSNPDTLAPSASSSQGGIHERTVLSPFYPPQSMPTQSAEKAYSRSSDGKNINTMRRELERSFSHVDNKSSRLAGLLADGSSFSAHDLSCGKNSCKKLDDDDDFRVPTFNQSDATQQSKETNLVEVSRSPPLGASILQKSSSERLNSCIQIPSSGGKHIDEANASEILSKANKRNHDEQRSRKPLVESENESPTYLETDVMLADNSKLLLVTADVGVQIKMSFTEKTNYLSSQVAGESTDKGALDGHGCLNDADFLENMNYSKIRSQSYSRESLEHIHGTNVGKENMPRLLKNADKSDKISETSMVDSISGLEISPDDVVGIIGPKQFWKARRAIVNQQRVFAIQVFELHRLIKVQKLFAASPHLLLDNPHLTKIQPKASSKSLPIASSLKLQQQLIHQRDESSQKPIQIADHLEDKETILPIQTQERGEFPRYAPQSGNPPSIPMAHDNSPSPWCFPPPANQWLIPVMLPSEGLVYKPYSGPCPPSAGFMSPFYGSYGHLALPPIASNVLNAAYAVPVPHTQQPNIGFLSGSPEICPNYFQTPYGKPVMNTVVSASAVEQSSPLNSTRPNGPVVQHSRNSCNMPITISEALSGCAPKHYPSRESEVQGSTASSLCDRAQREGRDDLPLFPMAHASGCSGLPSQSSGRESQTNVIKVVPHNACSATESAARIFKLIQQERKQLDW